MIKEELFFQYPELLTIAQISEILGIGRTKAYQLVRENKLEYIRIGRSIKVLKRDVITFIENKKDHPRFL